jgi:hypothetical protein
MGERVPQTVAFGGGGFSMEAGNRRLDDYVLAQDLIYVGGGSAILCGLSGGLALLPWSNAVHTPRRLPRGHDRGDATRVRRRQRRRAALRGHRARRRVSSREGARAFRVEATSAGDVAETELAVRHLRAPVLAPLAA